MHLDQQTVFVVTSIIAATLGALLVFTWLQARTLLALLWWGGAFLLVSVGIVMIAARGKIPDFWSLQVGLAIALVNLGMIWTGARVFNGRPAMPYALLGGAVLWLGLCQVEVFATSPLSRVATSAIIVTLYAWLAAFELWRDRAEQLISRWPAIVVLAVHGLISLLRIPLTLSDPMGGDPWLVVNSWQAIPELWRLVYFPALGFILLAMAKERSELRHRNASLIDPLTQLANRRAFFEGAMRRMRRQARVNAPIAVLLFDLDHFKWVNDRFGHAVGDRALCIFAETAVASLRPEDLVARIGGEEFAAILSGAEMSAAISAAERVRAAFVQAAGEINGVPVAGSVSIGVASANAAEVELDALIARADGALYLAKARGRNRVETAGEDARRLDGPIADALKCGAPLSAGVPPATQPPQPVSHAAFAGKDGLLEIADAPALPVGRKILTH
jgi:diguanylate cyclase (GGDEF)-like protein